MWWFALFACGAPAPEPTPAPAPEPVAVAAPVPDEAPPPGRIGGEPILPDPVVVGALDASVVKEAMKGQLSAIEACYGQHGQGRRGKVLARFLIEADGHVSKSTTQSTSLRQSETEACIHEHLLATAFPAPGRGRVIVSWPFSFPQ